MNGPIPHSLNPPPPPLQHLKECYLHFISHIIHRSCFDWTVSPRFPVQISHTVDILEYIIENAFPQSQTEAKNKWMRTTAPLTNGSMLLHHYTYQHPAKINCSKWLIVYK